MRIILASASERRHELLKKVVEDFEIKISNFDEDSVKFLGDFSKYVIDLSKGKALEISRQYMNEDVLIIGCDTIVAFDGRVLGKPKDKEQAFQMLKDLSGNTHGVYSGITLINPKNSIIMSEGIYTEVRFSELSDDEIWNYIRTGEPMDKAGAYGIQGFGGIFVEEIKGCYYNVVGLPINKLNKMLKSLSK